MPSPPTDTRASHMLWEIANAPDRGQIAIGDFIALLGERSFALIILVLSLPNALPVGIPGLSTVTGIPIMFIALQLLWGRDTIWLPRFVAKKRFSHHFLAAAMRKAFPVVRWLEKFLHPRLGFLCESAGERFIASLMALLGLFLALPVLGANFLPGICLAVLALALLEEDGALAAFGILFCAASGYLTYEMIALVADEAGDWLSG